LEGFGKGIILNVCRF